jgi:ornithine cyclodeaminase/alanine dehydrogenase-like protein (mu-crystallin family)
MAHKGLETLPFFSEDRIAGVLEWAPLIDTMERALVSLSADEVEQPVRQMVSVPGRNAIIAAMPAVGEAMAVKVVTLYHDNAGTGLPTHQAVIMVFDIANGTPLAVMDGRLITEMRTAAASAAAVRALAVETPEIVTIMGSGVQARAHAAALATVRPLGELRLWSRTETSGYAAAADIGATFFADAEEAVRGANIVVCATSATEPVLMGDWLKPGAFVVSVGWNGHNGRELDDAAMDNTVLVEEIETAQNQAGNIRGSDCEIFAEIGEIFTGRKTVPKGATVIYDSVGVAILDVAAAKLAYDLLTA